MTDTDSAAPQTRAVSRLALGVSVSFLMAQLFAWPLAFALPVFVGMLLQEPTAVAPRTALNILVTACCALLLGYLLTLFFHNYPVVMMLAYCVVLQQFYLFMLTAGAHPLALVGVVMGITVIPILAGVAPEIAMNVAWGIALNYVVALLMSWVMFAVIPVPAGTERSPPAAKLPRETATSIASELVVVTAPLMTAFLLFGWTNILVLAFSLLTAATMSAAKSARAGAGFVLANLLIAGLLTVVVYEVIVMTPALPFVFALVFGICLAFGQRIFSGEASGALWSTAFTGFLILLGGALLKEDVYISANVLSRVWQVFLATVYVVFAYRVIAMVTALAAMFSGAAWRSARS